MIYDIWYDIWYIIIWLSVYLFVPFSCYFFWGLLLALRSHDQIPASHWPSGHMMRSWPLIVPPPLFLLPPYTRPRPPQLSLLFFSFFFFLEKNHAISIFFFSLLMQTLQNCIGHNICIDREILCLPYAGFFYWITWRCINICFLFEEVFTIIATHVYNFFYCFWFFTIYFMDDFDIFFPISDILKVNFLAPSKLYLSTFCAGKWTKKTKKVT